MNLTEIINCGCRRWDVGDRTARNPASVLSNSNSVRNQSCTICSSHQSQRMGTRNVDIEHICATNIELQCGIVAGEPSHTVKEKARIGLRDLEG